MKKKNILYLWMMLVLLLFSVSCSADKAADIVVNFFEMKDCQAPALIEVSCTSPTSVSLVFDEEVYPIERSFSSVDVQTAGNVLDVELPYALPPDSYYDLRGRVKDVYGNTNLFSVRVWGFNANPVEAVINEFTTRGTDNQPDRTEILITEGGNIAGLTLYDGVPGDYRKSVVFPYAELSAGDYVVVYWTEKLPSTGSSSDHVFFICAETDSSLSDDNGILTLTSSPSIGGSVLDCAVYSSFTSSQYEGFGTKAVLARVEKAKENSWWLSTAIDSSKSTSTRSICRFLDSSDSDTASEWYVCETRGQSFGGKNTSAPYAP